MNFLKQATDSRFMIMLITAGWALFLFFSYRIEWGWNDLNTITGIVMIFVTFCSGIVIGQEYQLFKEGQSVLSI